MELKNIDIPWIYAYNWANGVTDEEGYTRIKLRSTRECVLTASLASKGLPSGYSKSICVRLHSENSEPTMLISQTTPDEHPPTPPSCRWPAVITLPTLAKFQLVWRRV